MKSIFHILKKKSGSQTFLAQKILAYRVVELGNQVVKKILDTKSSDLAHVLYFKNKTVTIGCAHPTVSQELKLHQATLLKEINSGLENKPVEKIHFIPV